MIFGNVILWSVLCCLIWKVFIRDGLTITFLQKKPEGHAVPSYDLLNENQNHRTHLLRDIILRLRSGMFASATYESIVVLALVKQDYRFPNIGCEISIWNRHSTSSVALWTCSTALEAISKFIQSSEYFVWAEHWINSWGRRSCVFFKKIVTWLQIVWNLVMFWRN